MGLSQTGSGREYFKDKDLSQSPTENETRLPVLSGVTVRDTLMVRINLFQELTYL